MLLEQGSLLLCQLLCLSCLLSLVHRGRVVYKPQSHHLTLCGIQQHMLIHSHGCTCFPQEDPECNLQGKHRSDGPFSVC